MRGGAAAQLDVVGREIDHVAVMHMAEMDGGQRRQHVERDLLGGAGAHARRAGDELRRRREQDGDVGRREQRRAVIVGDADGRGTAPRRPVERRDRIGRAAARGDGDQAVALAEAQRVDGSRSAPPRRPRPAGNFEEGVVAAGDQDGDAVARRCRRCRAAPARRPAPSGRNCRRRHRRSGRRPQPRGDDLGRPGHRPCAGTAAAAASILRVGRAMAARMSSPRPGCPVPRHGGEAASVRGRAICASSDR